MRQVTQSDIVRDKRGFVEDTITEKVRVPGVETLHQRPADEIAEILANVLRSRPSVTEVRYVVGDCIEVTFTNLNR